MPDGLYERDALAWAEQQAELLRRLAAGERVNALVDWSNVIEEVHDVGLSELRACESLMQQAMIHLLKLRIRPDSPAADHWREKAGIFLDDVARRFSPSMRQRISLSELYGKALRRVRTGAGEAEALPDECPFAFEELLAGDPALLLSRIVPPDPERHRS